MATFHTPAHIQYARSSMIKISASRAELVEIQNLYLSRRYRHCASACERLQRAGIHPLHSAFLHFYQAVCYEALGIAAHSYAASKIPFLERAQEAFAAALSSLPCASDTTVSRQHELREGSTLNKRFSPPGRYTQLSTPRTPTPRIQTLAAIGSASSVYSSGDSDGDGDDDTSDSGTARASDLTDDCPKRDFMRRSADEGNSIQGYGRPMGMNRTTSTVALQQLVDPITPHKYRLSQSLSSQHVLDESCVPFPLFSGNDSTLEMPASRTSSNSFLPTGIASNDDLNGKTDTSPPSPSGGTKQLKTTALHSMPQPAHLSIASPLEATTNPHTRRPLPPLPFNHNPRTFHIHRQRLRCAPQRATAVQALIAHFESTTPPGSPTTPTATASPWTPRFSAIKNAFLPLPTNDHLESYLASANLTRYNALLRELRIQLHFHIKNVGALVEQTRVAQHEREKARRDTGMGKRLASFWSFDTANNTPKATSARDDARAERIERLRREGWGVRKEKFGWKGSKYYEELRRVVELELQEHEMRSRRRA